MRDDVSYGIVLLYNINNMKNVSVRRSVSRFENHNVMVLHLEVCLWQI